MSRGKYIVLEGPQGAGKTTQIQELARRLRAAGLPVRTLREPDSQSDLTARAIRQLTQDPRYPMNTNTEVLLYNAARSQSLQVIKKSVEQDIICLVDRNYLTTLAIQYYGRGDLPDYDSINKIIAFAVNGVEPDLCVVLDVPVPTLRARAQARGQGERFDNLDEAFLERVRAGYLWEAKQRNYPVVFATEEPNQVSDAIWKLVTNTLSVRDNKQIAANTKPVSVKQIIQERVAAKAESGLDSTDINEAFVPKELQGDILDLYVQSISTLRAGYEKLQQKGVAPHIAGLTLPIATTAEAQSFAQSAPAANNPVVSGLLDDVHGSANGQPVSLLSAWPKNEFDVLATGLFAQSAQPFEALQNAVNVADYSTKADLFADIDTMQAALATGYSFEIIADYDTLQAIKNAGLSVTTQELTPRLGFDDQDGLSSELSDLYDACFDASLAAIGALQQKGNVAAARLLILKGHKQRAIVFGRINQFVDLLTKQNSNKNLHSTLTMCLEQISDRHPLLAEAFRAKAS